jgi:hypothetical protein
MTTKETLKLILHATVVFGVLLVLAFCTFVDFANGNDDHDHIRADIQLNSEMWHRLEEKRIDLLDHYNEYNTIVQLQKDYSETNNKLRQSISGKITTMELMQCQAKLEGFYKEGSIAQRQNNPCNTRRSYHWSQEERIGYYPEMGALGFLKFKTVDDGFNACTGVPEFYAENRPDITLNSYIWSFSPDGREESYVAYVTKCLGVNGSEKLKDLLQ